jgi:hypothetical protein
VGDTVNLRVYIIQQNGTGPTSVLQVLDPSSMALKVAVGILGGTPDVAQTSFTPSGYFLAGTLDFSTAAFAAKVAAGTQLYLHIQYGQSGNFTTAYVGAVTTQNTVIAAGATTTPAGDEYLSKIIQQQTFVPFIGSAGRTFTTVSPDGTKGTIWGTNNDGSARQDAIDIT